MTQKSEHIFQVFDGRAFLGKLNAQFRLSCNWVEANVWSEASYSSTQLFHEALFWSTQLLDYRSRQLLYKITFVSRIEDVDVNSGAFVMMEEV